MATSHANTALPIPQAILSPVPKHTVYQEKSEYYIINVSQEAVYELNNSERYVDV